MVGKSRKKRGAPAEPEVEVLDRVTDRNEDSSDDSDAEPELTELVPAPSEALPQLDDVDDDSEADSGGGLVRYDALSAYLREIHRAPAVDKEEEIRLAIQYRENKDLQAAYRLVTGNLWLVVKIARDYERAARNLLDLVQEGNIGLLEAVKNFDPYRGVRFPSYAVWWIRAYMLRFILANWRMVKIGTTQAQRKLFFNLKKEKEKLERQGFFPGPKLLAEKLEVKESEVLEMEQRLGSPDVSVFAPIGPESDADYLSTLPDQAISAEEALQEKEMHEMLHRGIEDFAKTLNEKERATLYERILNEEKVTLHELSERFSVSKERIRQIENSVRAKLHEFMQERMKEREI